MHVIAHRRQPGLYEAQLRGEWSDHAISNHGKSSGFRMTDN